MSDEFLQPTFIGIGAQKCASTWVYDILADHPEVVVSDLKELDFFSYRYDHGLRWYQRHFPAKPGARVCGEISPSYFHEPAVPERIKRHFPAAKILLALREPIARAISNHKHEVRIGHINDGDLSFETGMANNPMYVEQGLYAKHLAHWLDYFPKEQILVLLFEEISKERENTAKRIFEFLGIDANHQPAALNQTSNQSHAIKNQGLETVRIQIHKFADKTGMSGLLRAASRLGSRALYDRINRAPSESVIPPLRPETLDGLRARFDEDLAQLEVLLDRKLDHWREVRNR